MGLGVRESSPAATIADLVKRVEALERMPSGRNSIGVDKLLPCVKAGTPLDADFTAQGLPVPPIGIPVYDTSASKWWVRHSAGVYKGIVLA